jgi:hypothetical protein
MHASLAFVNGAGSRRRTRGAPAGREELRLLDTLLSTVNAEVPQPVSDDRKSKNERQADEERQADRESNAGTTSPPGRFQNDPPDPRNPNEERERHLKKIKR